MDEKGCQFTAVKQQEGMPRGLITEPKGVCCDRGGARVGSLVVGVVNTRGE